MTRRDYVLIASWVADARAMIDWPGACYTKRSAFLRWVDGICHALQRDNPRFNRARFVAACGIPEDTSGMVSSTYRRG